MLELGQAVIVITGGVMERAGPADKEASSGWFSGITTQEGYVEGRLYVTASPLVQSGAGRYAGQVTDTRQGQGGRYWGSQERVPAGFRHNGRFCGGGGADFGCVSSVLCE